MLGLSCLLPRRKKGGKLFLCESLRMEYLKCPDDIAAPKPIARHLVFSAQTSLPTPDPSSSESVSPNNALSSTRYKHPPHLLKHRFIPTGGVQADYPVIPDGAMEVDAPTSVAASSVKDDAVDIPSSQVTPKREKEKTHKRKADGQPSKKPKKVKTS